MMKIVGFTGVICAGKDYVAEQCGFRVFSMAEELYAITKSIWGLGKEDRNGPRGDLVRLMWQVIGQWGRGESAQVPLLILENLPNFPRSAEDFRRYSADLLRPGFGEHSGYWLGGICERLLKVSQHGRGVAVVTNVRFPNEARVIGSLYHVTASPETLAARWKIQGTPPEALKDRSEEYARSIDECLRHLEAHRSTPTPDAVDWLHENGFPYHRGVVWNDENNQAPRADYLCLKQLDQVCRASSG